MRKGFVEMRLNCVNGCHHMLGAVNDDHDDDDDDDHDVAAVADDDDDENGWTV